MDQINNSSLIKKHLLHTTIPDTVIMKRHKKVRVMLLHLSDQRHRQTPISLIPKQQPALCAVYVRIHFSFIRKSTATSASIYCLLFQ